MKKPNVTDSGQDGSSSDGTIDYTPCEFTRFTPATFVLTRSSPETDVLTCEFLNSVTIQYINVFANLTFLKKKVKE